jgi:hypothetical protein
VVGVMYMSLLQRWFLDIEMLAIKHFPFLYVDIHCGIFVSPNWV